MRDRVRRRSRAARRTASASGRASPCVVQKNDTPFRKPRNSGGSPSGVSEPPALATMKMKNTSTCTLCRRLSLARINGRTSTIAAPVVPIRLARTAPSASSATLVPGRAVQVAQHARCRRTPYTARTAAPRTAGTRAALHARPGARSPLCVPKVERERDDERRRPRERDLAEVPMPERRGDDERQQRDRREHPDERQRSTRATAPRRRTPAAWAGDVGDASHPAIESDRHPRSRPIACFLHHDGTLHGILTLASSRGPAW